MADSSIAKAPRIPLWLAWATLAFVSYGVWAILSKLVGDGLQPVYGQALSTIGMIPVIAALAWRRAPAATGRRLRGIWLAFAGGAISCLGNLPFYAALASNDAKVEAVFAVTALYPLVTILLAVGLLRERLGRVQMVGVALALAGIYFLNVSDEQGLTSRWLQMALLSIVLWGVAGFLQKVSTFDISSSATAVWFLIAFIPVGVAIIVLRPLPGDVSLRQWALAIAMGFALAFGNFAVIVAYANGKASIITPLVGLYPLISIPVAWLWFGDQIGWRESVGGVLALASIVALSCEPATKVE